MATVHKILLPTDFSECSKAAIRFGADLARRYDASVTLLHVDPEDSMTPGDDGLAADLRDLEAWGAGRVDSRSLHGDALAQIIELATEGKYDLIVMGTHGRTGFRHALLGSTTEGVVRTSPCPVVTVRAPAHTPE